MMTKQNVSEPETITYDVSVARMVLNAAASLCFLSRTSINQVMSQIVEQLRDINKTHQEEIAIVNPVAQALKSSEPTKHDKIEQMRQKAIIMLDQFQGKEQADVSLQFIYAQNAVTDSSKNLFTFAVHTLDEMVDNVIDQLIRCPQDKIVLALPETKRLQLEQWLNIKELKDIKAAVN